MSTGVLGMLFKNNSVTGQFKNICVPIIHLQNGNKIITLALLTVV